MALTHEEFNKKLSDILKHSSDTGKVSELLSDLKSDYALTLGQLTELENTNMNLTEKNSSLIEANGKLFMQIAIGEEKEESGGDDENVPQITIDDVLAAAVDEKGKFI